MARNQRVNYLNPYSYRESTNGNQNQIRERKRRMRKADRQEKYRLETLRAHMDPN